MTHPGQVLGPNARADVSWRISSYSNSAGGSCLAVGVLTDRTGRVAVRHSQQPDGLALAFGQPSWAAFIGGIKSDEFNART